MKHVQKKKKNLIVKKWHIFEIKYAIILINARSTVIYRGST